MTTNELLELVRAGFTKAEIAQITKAENCKCQYDK